ncbi:unnamed protein product, partial [Notodromas monacha]
TWFQPLLRMLEALGRLVQYSEVPDLPASSVPVLMSPPLSPSPLLSLDEELVNTEDTQDNGAAFVRPFSSPSRSVVVVIERMIFAKSPTAFGCEGFKEPLNHVLLVTLQDGGASSCAEVGGRLACEDICEVRRPALHKFQVDLVGDSLDLDCIRYKGLKEVRLFNRTFCLGKVLGMEEIVRPWSLFLQTHKETENSQGGAQDFKTCSEDFTAHNIINNTTDLINCTNQAKDQHHKSTYNSTLGGRNCYHPGSRQQSDPKPCPGKSCSPGGLGLSFVLGCWQRFVLATPPFGALDLVLARLFVVEASPVFILWEKSRLTIDLIGHAS